MIYFDSTHVYLSPNYFVQQLFGQNSGDLYLKSHLDAPEASKLTASTVFDSKSGDVIIKIVNGDDVSREINIQLNGLKANKKMKATKTVLTGSSATVFNEDGQIPAVKPDVSSGSVKPDFVCNVPANSLTVYRIHQSR